VKAKAVRTLECCLFLVLIYHPPTVASPPQQSDSVREVMNLFQRLRSSAPSKSQIDEKTINDYLQYSLRAIPRPGLQSCKLKIFPQNYISTFSVVDFDAIERWKPGTIPALLQPVLNGKKSIWVDCRFSGANGQLTFSVQKAYFESIRLPAVLVERVIGIVAARQPEKFDTSKPVPIPFGLKSLWTEGNSILGIK
jgi:hypothetical protein